MTWPGRLGSPSVCFCFCLQKTLVLKTPVCLASFKLQSDLRLLTEDIFFRLQVHLHNLSVFLPIFWYPFRKIWCQKHEMIFQYWSLHYCQYYREEFTCLLLFIMFKVQIHCFCCSITKTIHIEWFLYFSTELIESWLSRI